MPVRLGDEAPNFTAETTEGTITLYDYLGDGRLVDAHVRRLRTKIEHDASEPQLVVTVRGLGYRMNRL